MNKPLSAPAGAEDEPSFERALQRLEEIADRIESGDGDLAGSLALFEEGVRLLRHAEHTLGHAETRVQQLLEANGGFRLEPLPEDP